jgi:putative FmdB family regulatory protein
MPIYVYQGLTSGDTFELEQRISEAALTTHPTTGEPVKRLIGRPAISFKGSGFYANDSKSSATGNSSKSSSDTTSGNSSDAAPSGASESKSETKSESSSAPATPTPAAPAPSKD